MNKKELKQYIDGMNYSQLKNYYLDQVRIFEIYKANVKEYAKKLAELEEDNSNYTYILNDSIEALTIAKKEIKYYNDMLPIIKKELDKKEIDQTSKEEYNNYIEGNKISLKPLFEAIEIKRQEFYNNPKVYISKDKEIELSKKEIDGIIEELTQDMIYIIRDRIGNVIKVNRLDFNNNRGFDGIIKGENGMLNINTIVAGGYNIQKLHYRTLTQIYK